MCQQINESLNQMVETGSVPYYPVAFAQGLDFMTGAYVYRETIPTWWYLVAKLPDPSSLLLYSGPTMFPLEVEIVILSSLDAPVHYIQTCRGVHDVAARAWWQIVGELAQQWCVPPKRLSWWGWHLTTRGPPTLFRPGHVYDPNEQARRTYYDEDFDVPANELLSLNMAQERENMGALGNDDEWVFWRAAQLALLQGQRDAVELGWPLPVGIRGNPTGFTLVFDEDDLEDDLEDLSSEYESE